MKPAMIHVLFRPEYSGEGKTVSFLFPDADAAATVQGQLVKAAEDYHDRANDRERLFSFETVHGPSSVDVSGIASVGVEDPLGKGAEANTAWNKALAVMKGENDGAYEAAKAQAMGAA